MFEVDTGQTGAAPDIVFTEISKSNTDTRDRFFYLHLTHNRFFYLSLLTGDTESVYVFEVDTDQTGAAPNIVFTEINKSNTDTNVGQIFLSAPHS